MSIIYEQTPGGLYATGQRTVSTFPSGLIRVDQTFACKTSAAATHRATLAVGGDFPGDSYPAMDGLKIFPDPQEKRRDDGFTEFTVSGYGRLNNVGTILTFDNEVVDSRLISSAYIKTTRNATLNYVQSLSESTRKTPLIDSSITRTPLDSGLNNLFNTDGGQLANQTFTIRGVPYSPENIFDPHTLAFIGDGTVSISGAYSGYAEGTGISAVTTVLSLPTGQNQTCGTTCIATAQVVVTGDVRLASFRRYVSPTPVEIGYGLWRQSSTTETSFGYFREISASFESI